MKTNREDKMVLFERNISNSARRIIDKLIRSKRKNYVFKSKKLDIIEIARCLVLRWNCSVQIMGENKLYIRRTTI